MKFTYYLKNVLNEDMEFYRNDQYDGVVVPDKDKNNAKYIYSIEKNKIRGDVYVLKLKNNPGAKRRIKKEQYEIARDGLLSYIGTHPERAEELKNTQAYKDLVTKTGDKEYTSDDVYNFKTKIGENKSKVRKLVPIITNLIDELETKYSNNKDVLNFTNTVKDNIKKYRSIIFQAYTKYYKDLSNVDIKSIGSDINNEYNNSNNAISGLEKEIEELKNIREKLENNLDKQYFKNYNPTTDEPINFTEINVKTVEEAEDYLKKKCGLTKVNLYKTDPKALPEIVTAIVKIHEYYPEIFDKDTGTFTSIMTDDGLIQESNREIRRKNKSGELEKEINEKIDFNSNVPFSDTLSNIADIFGVKVGYEKALCFSSEEDVEKQKHLDAIQYMLRAFNGLDKYTNILNKFDDYNPYDAPIKITNDDGDLIKPFVGYLNSFSKKDFISFLREQDKRQYNGKLFSDKSDKEIFSDIKTFMLEMAENDIMASNKKNIQLNCDDASAYTIMQTNTIVLKERFYKNKDKFDTKKRRAYKEHVYSAGDNYPVSATILHEIGHTVDRYYGRLLFQNINSDITNLKKLVNIHIDDRNIKSISNYGAYSSAEMFAEAFASYYENPEKYSGTTKEVMTSAFKVIGFLKEHIKSKEYNDYMKAQNEKNAIIDYYAKNMEKVKTPLMEKLKPYQDIIDNFEKKSKKLIKELGIQYGKEFS